jgi:hypothetical protein
LPLPFSFGSSYTETIITTFLSGADTMKATAKKSLNGVGTGTLMLPTGTYTDVLRISGKIEESRTKNGLPDGYVYTTNIDYYYSEKVSHPLLYYAYKSSTGPENYAPFTQFVTAISTGFNNYETKSEIKIAPNPTSGIVHIISLKNEEGQIVLSNTLGEIVLKQCYSAGTTELNLYELPIGLYTLQITQGENIQTTKLIVSR